MLGVPTMLVAMMEHPYVCRSDLSSLKAIYSGGSKVRSRDRCRSRTTVALTIVFGQTDARRVALDDLGQRSSLNKAKYHRATTDAERRGEEIVSPGDDQTRSGRRDR